MEGVLYFEHQSSAKTALLLSNALINDKPMHVQEYTEEKIEVHGQEDTQAKEKIEQGVEPEVIISEMPEEHITHREGSERVSRLYTIFPLELIFIYHFFSILHRLLLLQLHQFLQVDIFLLLML